MSDDQKDRYGDKLRDAERGREEDYFAKRDRELLEKLRREAAGKDGAAVHMRCPKDGERLVSRSHLGVVLDECPKCGGMWIEKTQLEQLARR